MRCSNPLIPVALFAFFVADLPSQGGVPSIVIQPQSQIVGSGETVRFSVLAEGRSPVEYQWRFHGQPLPISTNASLILSNVQPAQTGNYSVMVSDSAGTNTSNEAFLEVCWEVQPTSFEQVLSPTNTPVAWRLKFDSAGNLYLAARLEGRVGFSLIKLTPSHEVAWMVKPIPEPSIQYLALTDFAIDATGAVHIVGVSATNYYSDREQIIIWKFDPDGNQVWSNRYESAGFAHGIAVDSAGNVVVVGNTSEGINSNGVNKPPGDVELAQFSPTGQRLWKVTYDGPGHDTRDLGPVATDASGNIYFALTGYRRDGSSFYQELVLAKYNSAGINQWIARRSGNQMYPPNSLLVDRDGNLVVGLSMWHGAPLDTHETIKFDTDGNFVWEIQHTVDSDIQMTGARALDEGGNIYFAMIRYYDHKLIITKYDPAGRYLWSVEYDSSANWLTYQNGALGVGLDQNVTFAAYGGEWTPSSLNFASFLQNTIEGRPVIHRAQPQSRRVASGTTVHFDVTATGLAPLNFQWRRDGIGLPGATNAALVLANVTTSDSGGYSVLVTNSVGCSVSTEELLTVVDVPPFRFDQVQVNSNTFAFTLTAGGRLYWIESSTNLVDWSPVFGYGGGPTVISKGNQPQLFLRAWTYP